MPRLVGTPGYVPRTAWKKGQTGNKTTHRKLTEDVRILARLHTTQAIAVLAKLLRCHDYKARAAAAVALLDRAWGKPAQAVYPSLPPGPAALSGMVPLDELLQLS